MLPSHRRTFGRQLLGLAGLAIPAASRAGAAPDDLRTLVDGTIRPLMARHDIPGMAVALTVAGRATSFRFGVASRETAAPVTDRTLFEIGSISKMLTATLAAHADATGALSLADTPGRHLPALKGRPIDRATLLHLGTYTAGGLPLQFPDHVSSDAAAFAYVRQWKPDAAPGTVRAYSNPSIGLLGAAVAAALKAPFAKLMEARLLPAFGMRDTYVQVPPQAMADYAWGHRDGRPVRVRLGPLGEPAYGIRCTAADLLRFVQAQIDPGALDAPMRRAVEATQVARFGVGPMVQGFGWEQFPWPLTREQLLAGNAEDVIFEPKPVQPVPPGWADVPRLFDKTGSTNGFGAYVVFVPARKVGLVMLANRSLPIPARIDAAYAILSGLGVGSR